MGCGGHNWSVYAAPMDLPHPLRWCLRRPSWRGFARPIVAGSRSPHLGQLHHHSWVGFARPVVGCGVPINFRGYATPVGLASPSHSGAAPPTTGVATPLHRVGFACPPVRWPATPHTGEELDISTAPCGWSLHALYCGALAHTNRAATSLHLWVCACSSVKGRLHRH